MRKGAEKYAERNWEKGIPISRCIASLCRHLFAYMAGDNNEDHMAAVRTNASFIMHFEEMVKRGWLPASIADMPSYIPAKSDPSHCPSADEQWSPQTQALMKTISIEHIDDLGNGKCRVHRRKPHVYIAGPMRGIKDFNFPAFDAARDKARELGWEPISPADLDRQSGVNETTEPQFKPEQVRAFVERDSKALLSLHAEQGDAIALLPGWENSTGAVAEVFMAKWLGLRILYATDFNACLGISTNKGSSIYSKLNDYMSEQF